MVHKNDTLLIVTNNSDSDSENRVTVLSATPVASATAAVPPLSCRVAPAAPPPDHLMRSLSWPPLCANEQHTSSIPPSTCFNLVTHGTHPYVYSGGGRAVRERASVCGCVRVCACGSYRINNADNEGQRERASYWRLTSISQDRPNHFPDQLEYLGRVQHVGFD